MELLQTTLCYLEKDGAYLMLHRVKKKNDVNHDKWVGVGGKFEPGEDALACALREGCLEWVDKAAVQDLPIWQGDKIFFKLLAEDAPFFHLELTYDGDVLVKAVLDGVSLAL